MEKICKNCIYSFERTQANYERYGNKETPLICDYGDGFNEKFVKDSETCEHFADSY